MSLTWRPDMAVGIRAIDLQHRELIEIINELEAALKLDEEAPLERVLQRLLSYAVFHFEAEESMMRAKSALLGHVSLHILEHEEFVDKLRVLRALQGIERHGAIEAMLEYLKHWVVDHIQKTDRDMAALLLTATPVHIH